MTPDIPAAPLFGEPVTQHPSHDVLDFLATRRSASAVKLIAPGPDRAEVETLVRLASRVPDHGKLAPWRFIVLETRAKAEFADGLEALAIAKGDSIAAGKLAKVRAPPLAIAVVSSPRTGKIPEWEQRLSAGAVCTTLLYAGLAMGYGANWITDWYSYDAQAAALLGLTETERVAGFILLGTAPEPPHERERPDPVALVTYWRG